MWPDLEMKSAVPGERSAVKTMTHDENTTDVRQEESQLPATETETAPSKELDPSASASAVMATEKDSTRKRIGDGIVSKLVCVQILVSQPLRPLSWQFTCKTVGHYRWFNKICSVASYSSEIRSNLGACCHTDERLYSVSTGKYVTICCTNRHIIMMNKLQ